MALSISNREAYVLEKETDQWFLAVQDNKSCARKG